MKREIQYFIYILMLGMGLVAYAHANFTSKDTFSILLDTVIRIETKLDSLIIQK